MLRAAFAILLLVALAARRAHADTVVLASGKRLENVIVSQNDDQLVVINPWNSRCPQMRWEVPDGNVIARAKVKEVVIADPPPEDYRRRTAKAAATADAQFELAEFCGEHGMKAERQLHLEQTLALDPAHAAALAAYGETKWKSFALTHPRLAPEVVAKEREYVAAPTPADARAKLAELDALVKTPAATAILLERARRSAQVPKGVREKVPLAIDSEKAPGGTYCICVPSQYDPLAPIPLIVGLHGGGAGGKDPTLVTGSGESAMPFYQELAERWRVIVVCPTALKAPWSDPANVPLLEAVLKEMLLRFNVDRTRVYLTGHSLGGYGTWHFGPRWPEVWAACAPCAGGGGPGDIVKSGVPVYIYHGADDQVVEVGDDRTAAKVIRGDERKKARLDFVYTELDGVGHGFPDWVRNDIFRWFLGRARPHSKKGTLGPDSSFDMKVTKAEIQAFGDPEHPFAEGGAADGLATLIADLKKGGAAGQDARAKLAEMKQDATASAVAGLLRSNKTSVDTRVLAAALLGDLALPACIRLLLPALDDEDYRVLEAATDSFGRIGGKEAVEPLRKCAARLERRFEESFLGGREIVHTEYQIRLASFATWLRAVAKLGPAHAGEFLPLIDRNLVTPVFTPKQPYSTPSDEDERFSGDSARSRLMLVRALKDCLVALGDPKGKELLARVKEKWGNDGALASACEDGIAELGG